MKTIILNPNWRTMDELFSPKARAALEGFDVIWGKDDPIPQKTYQDALPKADALIAATPVVTAETLEIAKNLKVVIEVSGAFPGTIDYESCAKRGVEVLSCAPGFRAAVAEMGLGMTLAATRGLVREHEAFRSGQENWLQDCEETDFTLFGVDVGFVGFGQIAQEMTRLLAPFNVNISTFDPWLSDEVAQSYGVTRKSLPDLAASCRVLYVTAVPTAENAGLVNADILSRMPTNSLLVILSRAHLVDFDAVTAEARKGRIAVATDVFPSEPLAKTHLIRALPNVILSPHRAAAVSGGRQLIGDLIVQDLNAIAKGQPQRGLARADLEKIRSLAGIGDAASVEDMAKKRY